MSRDLARNPRTAGVRRPSIILAGLFLAASCVVGGCVGGAAAMAEATSGATRAAGSPDAASQAAAAMNAFGLDFYKRGLAAGNTVFSPTSVVVALSMAQAGARGATASQMDAVLHAAAGAGGGNGINSLSQVLAGRSGSYKDLIGRDRPLTLTIANAPFAQSDLALQPQYLDTLAQRYGAGLRLADFRGDPNGACRLIDSWVGDQTEGRIPKLLDTLDSSTRLVLVNAVYLKAAWLEPFNPAVTTDAPFTRPDGSGVSVPTMSLGLSSARYASGSGWQAVELPYTGGALAMTIVVPDDMAAFESNLDGPGFDAITSALQTVDVDLTMPRFKIETKSDISSALEKMGMPLAFDPDRADFSGITTQERLFVSAVVHQADISVDEAGTEATAATAVVVAAASGMPVQRVTLHVDRPYMFAVRDTETGAILFLGRVVDPSA